MSSVRCVAALIVAGSLCATLRAAPTQAPATAPSTRPAVPSTHPVEPDSPRAQAKRLVDDAVRAGDQVKLGHLLEDPNPVVRAATIDILPTFSGLPSVARLVWLL